MSKIEKIEREIQSQNDEIQFSFVTDPKIIALVKDYYDQALKAYEVRAFAGALVLTGGVLEGLLASALLQKEALAREKYSNYFRERDGNDRPIERWHLTDLITVAKGLDLIGEDASKLAFLLRDFRNFIHPCNVVQKSARANQRLARIALDSVGEVARSLRARLHARN